MPRTWDGCCAEWQHAAHEAERQTLHIIDLGRMANLKLVDKQGKELVELTLQVLA